MSSLKNDVKFFYEHAKQFNKEARALIELQWQTIVRPFPKEQKLEYGLATVGYVLANFAKGCANLLLAVGALGLCLYSLGGDKDDRTCAANTVGLQISTVLLNVVNMGLAFFALILRTFVGPFMPSEDPNIRNQQLGRRFPRLPSTLFGNERSRLLGSDISLPPVEDEKMWEANFCAW